MITLLEPCEALLRNSAIARWQPFMDTAFPITEVIRQALVAMAIVILYCAS